MFLGNSFWYHTVTSGECPHNLLLPISDYLFYQTELSAGFHELWVRYLIMFTLMDIPGLAVNVSMDFSLHD